MSTFNYLKQFTAPESPEFELQTEGNPQQSGQIASFEAIKSELDCSLNVILSYETKLNGIFYITNVYLEPQLQDGPKCGLVALSIGTTATKEFVSAEELFKAALALNFTKEGEMFSAAYLAQLAEKCCQFKATVLKDGLSSNLRSILNSLLKGSLVLIPYDADFNHAPCCKKGMRAHWAVISGFVILEENDIADSYLRSESVVVEYYGCSRECNCTDSSRECSFRLSFSFNPDISGLVAKRPLIYEDVMDGLEKGKLFLIGRQGKSRRLGLWSFEDMDKSNGNLNIVSPARRPCSYILPEGGIAENLKGRAIILDHSAPDRIPKRR